MPSYLSGIGYQQPGSDYLGNTGLPTMADYDLTHRNQAGGYRGFSALDRELSDTLARINSTLPFAQRQAATWQAQQDYLSNKRRIQDNWDVLARNYPEYVRQRQTAESPRPQGEVQHGWQLDNRPTLAPSPTGGAVDNLPAVAQPAPQTGFRPQWAIDAANRSQWSGSSQPMSQIELAAEQQRANEARNWHQRQLAAYEDQQRYVQGQHAVGHQDAVNAAQRWAASMVNLGAPSTGGIYSQAPSEAAMDARFAAYNAAQHAAQPAPQTGYQPSRMTSGGRPQWSGSARPTDNRIATDPFNPDSYSTPEGQAAASERAFQRDAPIRAQQAQEAARRQQEASDLAYANEQAQLPITQARAAKQAADDAALAGRTAYARRAAATQGGNVMAKYGGIFDNGDGTGMNSQGQTLYRASNVGYSSQAPSSADAERERLGFARPVNPGADYNPGNYNRYLQAQNAWRQREFQRQQRLRLNMPTGQQSIVLQGSRQTPYGNQPITFTRPIGEAELGLPTEPQPDWNGGNW